MVGRAKRTGEAQPVDDHRRRAEGQQFGAAIAGIAVDVDQDLDAIVGNAARTDQSVIVTTLGGLAEAAERSPALSIIVIGENVKLAEELDWLAK